MSKQPSLYERAIIWCITHISTVNNIIQAGIGEAYDLGYKNGIIQGSKINGKTSQRKARKAIKEAYNVKARG